MYCHCNAIMHFLTLGWYTIPKSSMCLTAPNIQWEWELIPEETCATLANFKPVEVKAVDNNTNG